MSNTIEMLNTANFLKDTIPSREYAQYTEDFKSPLTSWIYEHPTIVKTTETATGILGVVALGMAFSSPFGLASILTGLAGATATGISAVALKCLDIVVAPQHDMANHVFTPASCEGGRLYYQGDVPILEIDAGTPYKAGWAHGHLLAEQLQQLKSATSFALNTLMKQPRAEDVPDTIDAIRKQIPEEYLLEMEGLVAGYNARREGWMIKGEELTVDEVILLHLMPDSMHFSPSNHEHQSSLSKTPSPMPLGQVACTVVINQDENSGPTFGRNMDWPAFGIAGTNSLVINRKNKETDFSTIEVGVPGFVGTLTGMNSKGLALAMNVCSGSSSSIKGMPAALYNRRCLESCASVEDVESFVDTKDPLGPYHLSIADHKTAKSFHFYQDNLGGHFKRGDNSSPLITTNCNYNQSGMDSHMHYSIQRHNILDEYFQDVEHTVNPEFRDHFQLTGAALSLPYVNNSITTHSVVMQPRTGRMEVAFDNAWSGTRPRCEIDTNPLLHMKEDSK